MEHGNSISYGSGNQTLVLREMRKGPYHQNKKIKEWIEKYSHLIGQYYPDYFCHCTCQGQIKIQESHKYNGIPKFIKGHNTKNGNSPFLREDVREKQQESFRDPIRNKKISQAHTGMKASEESKQKRTGTRPDIHKEAIRAGKGHVYPGPDWWKSMRDLVLLAVHIYGIQYIVASKHIREVLKEKNLTRLDVVLATNFWAGHNMIELAVKYKISKEDVYSKLKNFEKTFPNGVFQTQVSAPRAKDFCWSASKWEVDWTKVIFKF